MKTSTITIIKMALIMPLLFFVMSAFAQNVPKDAPKEAPKDVAKVSFKAIGSIAVSYHAGSESAFLNFGGPGLKLEYGKFAIAFNMFPSLRYFQGDIDDKTDVYRTRAEITPILGSGLQLSYKKLALVLPMYYLPTNNVWLMSAGVGYKF